jgi:hypothetical protein
MENKQMGVKGLGLLSNLIKLMKSGLSDKIWLK